jgi:hypothetical protein
MDIKKITITLGIGIILTTPSCSSYYDSYQTGYLAPLTDPTPTGKYIYLFHYTSTSKSWIKLADNVAQKINSFMNKNPIMKSKPIYIMPGKNSIFEKTYRELLGSALNHYNLLVSETPGDNLIVKYNTCVIYKNMEIIVNTTLNYKGAIIFKDSSTLYLRNESIADYLIKMDTQQQQSVTKTYYIVDN